ncbi:hypothetical protein ABH922_002208 [Rhodococcus sp. 27YEA15]|uniref:hypothetical protein n=1 Tax=Rhodococcus sp. 27YEA15 TaxID=3156259 RepID=UPI003C7A961A
MGTAGITNILIAAVVLIWLMFRQLTAQPLREHSRLGLVLIIIGAVETVSAFSVNSFPVRDLVWVAASILVGVGIAAVRGYTVRIWRQDSDVYRQGTWITAILWIVGIGQHLLVDQVVSAGLGAATLLLYFGIVIAAQRQVILSRARSERLFA